MSGKQKPLARVALITQVLLIGAALSAERRRALRVGGRRPSSTPTRAP